MVKTDMDGHIPKLQTILTHTDLINHDWNSAVWCFFKIRFNRSAGCM